MHDTGFDFSPSLIHPYYIIRSGLKKAVVKHAGHLGGKLLDFGCGSKPYRSYFSVEEYIGVDFENPGHPHDNEQIDVYYDGKSIPFEDGRFDSILCSEVFEHVFNLEEILEELHRVLKPGGKMMITCPFVWNEHEVPFDYARYTRFALEALLSKSGFQIVEYEKSGNFITTITQMMTLYAHHHFKGPWRKVFLLRWIYKFCFFLVPNLLGIFFGKLLPTDQSLYLNNVVVASRQ